MKTSLIVTTYNSPDTLKKVLNGIKLQKVLPDELLIADDGSGQETRSLVDSFKKELPFQTIHVWQEDLGFRASMVRNAAIQAACGEYIILLDGDCVPEVNFIADHLRLAEKGFFFQGKRILLKKDISPRFEAEYARMRVRLMGLLMKGGISNPHHILRAPFLPALKDKSMKSIKSCNMGIFRSDLVAVNGFNEDFTGWGREDSELAARLYKFGLKRKNHPFMAICFHLWHPENSKERLSMNEELLQRTISGAEYRCRNGIIKT